MEIGFLFLQDAFGDQQQCDPVDQAIENPAERGPGEQGDVGGGGLFTDPKNRLRPVL